MAGASTRPPSSTVFIGNIPYDVTDQMLHEIFSEVGAIKSLRLVTDKDSGKPKGYGFCEYHDQATAESAVRNLNGHEVSGRNLRVDFADEHDTADRRPKRDREPGGAGGGGGGGAGGGRPAAPGAPPGTRPVGHNLVAVAAQHVSTVLQQPPSFGPGQERINNTIANMTPMQLFEIMNQMKTLLQQNLTEARQILVQNPQLTKALFQAQILLGMVKAPPPPQQPAVPPPAPAPVQLPPQPQPVYQAPAPPAPVLPQQVPPPYAAPPPGAQPQPLGMGPPQVLPGQPGMVVMGGAPPPGAVPPPQPAYMGPPPMQAPVQVAPPPAILPAAPGPMAAGSAPVQGNMVQLNGAEMQGVLARVLTLTPQQVEQLPPQYKALVLQTQQLARAQAAGGPPPPQ